MQSKLLRYWGFDSEWGTNNGNSSLGRRMRPLTLDFRMRNIRIDDDGLSEGNEAVLAITAGCMRH